MTKEQEKLMIMIGVLGGNIHTVQQTIQAHIDGDENNVRQGLEAMEQSMRILGKTLAEGFTDEEIAKGREETMKRVGMYAKEE
ncbi:MAG: hypothetical protein F4X82_01855 [Candidatus Spechtbacteria bacterium SB0662_bin_43]|uniref:Uncharacterized protein n=1 Tax=Candidatus Spechtbacteria bacterium SB0662_bin_43 TaxID=2604897 RepID=A0A845DA65_9BACT|nr:hypothetical protein [Candidatus Spechtbacteria bacterium SB0662_bin_43]